MKTVLFCFLLSIPVEIAAFAFSVGVAPEPLKIRAFTPEQVSAQLDVEQKQRNYDKAEEVAARVLRRNGCSDEFAELIGRASVDEGISPRVVAATVYVESTCRDWVVSPEGAVGLMQVVPKVWHHKVHELKNPEFNVRVGTHILGAFIRAYGLREGLHHYNGMGIGCDACDQNYSGKVLQAAGIKA